MDVMSYAWPRKEGLSKGKDEVLKGKLVLEHSLGLGHKPNVIPPGEADIGGELRTINIGWHPVGGLGGKWFAEKTRLGKKITENTNHYPDPTQHWAVLVGEYCHELWMVCSIVQLANLIPALKNSTGRASGRHLHKREDQRRGMAHIRSREDEIQR